RCIVCFFFSSRRRHTRLQGDWSSDVCSSDLIGASLINIGTASPAGRANKVANPFVPGIVAANPNPMCHVLVSSGGLAPSSLGKRSEERRVGKECRCRGSGGGYGKG